LELGADDGSDPTAMAARCARLAVSHPLQALAGVCAAPFAGRAWLVTQGAQRIGDEVSAGGRWQAPAWGLGRVFALEQPARWGGLIDLAPASDVAESAGTLIAALDADDGEDQTAWRGGVRLACRLVPDALPSASALRLHADATYLVTGGFGGLGLLVARWLVEQGARHIALLGRHPDPDASGVRALEALGASVHSLSGDVSDATAMAASLQRLAKAVPPLRGVLHLAADLSAAPLTELTAEQVATMLRPKLDGTLVLQRLTQDLDFLVLFSSTTALLGASGLAHYAAANAFLDATAEHADRAGRPVLSVSWGTWAAMRLASSDSQQSFREAGLEPMDNAAALDALRRLMCAGAQRGIVARVDWDRLKAVHEARRARPLLRHLGTPAAGPSPLRASGDAPSMLVRRIGAAPASLRRDLLVEHVQREVAAVLGWPDKSAVAPASGLFDLGMDSLMAVELKRRLEQAVGYALPSTLTFNYPNVDALAGFLDVEMAASASAAPAPAAARAPAEPRRDERPLDDMSDEEIERRLLARLDEVG
jgi:NAD(P)-dependent dehydrogenase (short-subunit alcohol dehydrogenase family)/acyl carrier protein